MLAIGEAREAGAMAERKRIIELFEGEGHYYDYPNPCKCGAPTPEWVTRLIDLIEVDENSIVQDNDATYTKEE
jgi:hypothetical protein